MQLFEVYSKARNQYFKWALNNVLPEGGFGPWKIRPIRGHQTFDTEEAAKALAQEVGGDAQSRVVVPLVVPVSEPGYW